MIWNFCLFLDFKEGDICGKVKLMILKLMIFNDVIITLIIICLTHTSSKLKKHCFETLKGRIEAILAKIDKNKFLFLKTLLTVISSFFPHYQ